MSAFAEGTVGEPRNFGLGRVEGDDLHLARVKEKIELSPGRWTLTCFQHNRAFQQRN